MCPRWLLEWLCRSGACQQGPCPRNWPLVPIVTAAHREGILGSRSPEGGVQVMSGYLDCSGREDRLSGGARMIPVATPVGQYQVWVKRVGSNPGLRVLLLHGGPGETHEYLEACDSYLPAAGVEY